MERSKIFEKRFLEMKEAYIRKIGSSEDGMEEVDDNTDIESM
jgi:hypothetical protein